MLYSYDIEPWKLIDASLDYSPCQLYFLRSYIASHDNKYSCGECDDERNKIPLGNNSDDNTKIYSL